VAFIFDKEIPMAVPTKDSQLVNYAATFASIVSAAPTVYNTTAAAALVLTNAATAFSAAYAAQQADGAQSKTLTAAKNSARLALLNSIRPIYGACSASATLSDAQKVALGVSIRRLPAPQPAPTTQPVVSIVSVLGRTVQLRLRDSATPHRVGKPVNVSSATILSFVGATPPASIGQWKFEGNATKTVVDVTFPDTVAPGTLVWFAAFWSNGKDQSGPVSDPISTYLQYGSVSMVA
jgi:hypothetical protein